MSNHNDIEKLFKEKLKDHQVDVDPRLWEGVQSGIQASGAASGGAAGMSGKIIAGVAAGITAAGIGAAALFYMSDPDPNPQQNTPVEVAENEDRREETADKETTDEKTETDENKAEETASGDEDVSRSEPETPNEVDQQDNTLGDQLDESKETSGKTGESSGSTEEQAVSGEESPEGADDKQTVNSGESAEASSSDRDIKKEFEKKIHVTPVSGNAPLTVELSSYESLKRAKWETGDGAEPIQELTAVHEFKEPGEYTVALTGETEDGEFFIDMETVKVKAPESQPEKEMKAPALINVGNVITPNGDGVNDELKFVAENVNDVTLEIFNSGGGLVFRTNSTGETWDGKDRSGQNCPEGTYFYRVIAEGKDGKKYRPKGSLTLRR